MGRSKGGGGRRTSCGKVRSAPTHSAPRTSTQATLWRRASWVPLMVTGYDSYQETDGEPQEVRELRDAVKMPEQLFDALVRAVATRAKAEFGIEDVRADKAKWRIQWDGDRTLIPSCGIDPERLSEDFGAVVDDVLDEIRSWEEFEALGGLNDNE